MQASDWNDYQAFLAIARGGQMARAAQALGVDATTIGRRLRRLEARLGATLFEQTREGQLPTEAGEALLIQVEAMARAASAISEGAGPAAALSGSVRISVPEGLGGWFLPPYVTAFAQGFPDLTLDLVANSGLLSLTKREADVAVTLSRPKAGPVIARKLADYALRLYASQAYLAAHHRPARATDLAQGHRLIGYIPDLLYDPALNYLGEFHPGLPVRLRSSSINAQHRLIAAGAGIGVLPCFIGESDPSLVTVLPDRRVTRSFWLVTHKDTHNLARVRAVRDWLGDAVQQGRALLLPPG